MIQRPEPRIILATASAARQAMLARAGIRFTAQAAAVDEASIKDSARAEGLSPAETAMLLAEAKARRIARREPEALVIGADQMLVCATPEGNLRWFDKPPDMAAAREQLLALRGKPHELVTAMVCWRYGERVWQHLARPRLTMRDFSEEIPRRLSGGGRRGGARLGRRISAGGAGGPALLGGGGGTQRHPRPAAGAPAGFPARPWGVAGLRNSFPENCILTAT